MKPVDGKEASVIGVRTTFCGNGRIDGQYKTLVNLKGSKSQGTVSFFTQETDKVGISVRIDELQKFMNSL